MQEEYLKFKRLLEYFVSHLEWIQNKQSTFIGYDKYIKPYVDNGSFKMTGQGYDGAEIQNQIKGSESYSCGKICINIQGNYGSYKSVKCYLNWDGTGLNILARWKDNQISGLYQDEFIYWEKPTRRVNSGKEYSIEKLKLFKNDEISEELIDFFTTFKQRFETFQKNEKTKKLMSSIYKKKDLLKYKKQIILQGPPGTGKTREAKLIAEIIIFEDIKIDISYFREIVKSLKEVSATRNNNPIIIDNFIDDLISFKGTKFIPKYNFTIQELYDCYITGDFQNEDFVQYSQYAKRCLVLQIVDTFQKTVNREQFKLIQFHPTYTYEDFVRGIVAESKGDKIAYKNINKTLGLFAEEAFKNYKASNDTTSESNIEAWINSKFEEFKNDIEAKLPEEETLLSGDITIFEVTDTYFKYAKSWQTPGYLKFNEFKKLVKAIILNEIELSNKQLDKEKFIHAHYRYTYYNALLKKFFESYEYKGESYSELPKNYVLIIDEINRANLSSVLGELIYALEYRGEAVDSIYAVNDDTKLILPPNLYIIGTMNTADRSVGHIDYAIRRRFAFVDVLPENLKEKQGLENFHEALFLAVEKLFKEHTSPEFEVKDVQLGHSYFIDKSDEENGAGMDIRFEYEIKPILLEYVKDGVLIGKDIKKEIEDLSVHI